MPTEWSCARRLPGDIGTKVKFQNLLSEDANELNRKYDLFLFNFFIACSFMKTHFFFCTYQCGSGELTEPITKSRGIVSFWTASFYKNKLAHASVHDRCDDSPLRQKPG